MIGMKMSLIEWMKNIGVKLIGSSLKKELPEFEQDELRRYEIVFSGIVQDVGFRYEMWLMAEKLELTGFVENLPNGDVYAEIQGEKNRIMYLIEYMKAIPRICIENMDIDEMELREEKKFTPIY